MSGYANGTAAGVGANSRSGAAPVGLAALSNPVAERGVLGTLLLDPTVVARVEDILRPADFYVEAHRWIYTAILNLSQRQVGIDAITVSDELERDGHLDEAGGASYLMEMVADVTTTAHIVYHAEIVKRCAVLRHLLGMAGKAAELTYSPDATPEQVIAFLESMLIEAGQLGLRGQRDALFLSEILGGVVEEISDRRTASQEQGVATGFHVLDKMLGGGLRPGNLAIIAGRPGMGKSSLLFSMARNMGERNKTVLIHSLEMSKEEIAERLLSMQSKVDHDKIRSGQLNDQEFDVINYAATKLSGFPILIDDSRDLTLSSLRAKARRLHARYGLDLIGIDYLQLMHSGERIENRQQEISEISRSLKVLAGQLHVPIIALSQLNREVEKRGDKRPMLSDLRESGAIEQDSDVVMFCYRADYYDETAVKGAAEVIVAKQRNGATGTASLYFNAERAMYTNLELDRHDIRL